MNTMSSQDTELRGVCRENKTNANNIEAVAIPKPITDSITNDDDTDGPRVVIVDSVIDSFAHETIRDSVYAKTRTVTYVSMIRTTMKIFFSFYLLFALIIIFLGKADLRHHEHFISNILHLEMEEITLQRMFAFNALFLSVSAFIGLFAFIKHQYKLFLAFSVGLLFTMIFSMVSLRYSIAAYNTMDQVRNNHSMINVAFEQHMKQYDWVDFNNQSSQFINKFQFEFNCCGGSHGWIEWEKLKPHNLPVGAFPVSCCQPLRLDELNIKWCRYQDVENQMSCPKAFYLHLVDVQSRIKAQLWLLWEICFTQVLTVVVFFAMILCGERFIVRH